MDINSTTPNKELLKERNEIIALMKQALAE